MEKVVFHPDYHGEEICELTEKEGVVFLEFKPFMTIPFLVHGFSTRLGGISDNEFSSMNLSYSRGDDKEKVDENYIRICKALSIQREQLVFTDQIHETNVQYADGTKNEYEGTDGLITDQKNLVLTTSYADCVPLYFVDIKKQVIGLSHSGWRGSASCMGAKTIKAMDEQFGSRKEDILALIGPSICKDCYEVSRDVADAFYDLFGSSAEEEIIYSGKNAKFHLDLWKTNRWILEKAGIRKENIYTAGLCTCCNSKLLFSHRASHGKRGNMNGFFGLK